jgi:hypothetical protein
MTYPLPSDAVKFLPVDHDGTVTDSVPCLECGYIVRGMNAAGSCPECGTPIARSLRALLLRCADPTWLGMMHVGFALVGIFIIVNVLLPLDLVASWVADDPLASAAGWVMMALLTCMFVLGQWMLTTAEPTGMLARREDHLRLAIRGLTLLSMALLLIHDALTPRIGVAGASTIGIAASLTVAALVLMSALHMRRLADRIPDSELHTAITAAAMALGVSFLSYAALIAWAAVQRQSIAQRRPVNVITMYLNPRGDSAILAILWMIGILAVVASVGVVVVCLSFRAALRETLREVEYRPTSHNATGG